jgi:RimJ/RimL family protein N-acetyltransferase
MFGPELKGVRLRLRAPTVRDLPYFTRWFTDEDIVRYWWVRDGFWTRHRRLAAMRLFISAGISPTAVFWTIELRGKPIVRCHIRHIDRAKRDATAAILIGEKSHQNKGLASEAIAVRNAFAFRRLRLHKISATTVATNTATRKLLERAGYRLVGTSREEAHIAGKRHDVLLFELLRNDFEHHQDLTLIAQ